MISKLAAGFVPTFSAADETIFTLEDHEGKAYSTGDRNVYTDKRKQQKLIMDTAEIMRTANWTFTGKEKKTEDTNVCVKTHEANTVRCQLTINTNTYLQVRLKIPSP